MFRSIPLANAARLAGGGPRRQSGAALVVSLLILIVLTLLGLTVMNTAVMQERMAGNVREENEAFQSAEATIREIEQAVRVIAQGGSGGVTQLSWRALGLQDGDCSLQNPPWAANWDLAPWSVAPQTGNRYLLIALDEGVDQATGLPRGAPCAFIDSNDPARAVVTGWKYMIVARASGPQQAGDVILQSIFYWPM
ncbi:MAG: PilX N-terminal domain-containing pilus assembly protein [Xanthomonadales bacterium]|nr:PilX N-terminal domain-containing pilus assembly protein [Xanthomonadales bacterium]